MRKWRVTWIVAAFVWAFVAIVAGFATKPALEPPDSGASFFVCAEARKTPPPAPTATTTARPTDPYLDLAITTERDHALAACDLADESGIPVGFIDRHLKEFQTAIKNGSAPKTIWDVLLRDDEERRRHRYESRRDDWLSGLTGLLLIPMIPLVFIGVGVEWWNERHPKSFAAAMRPRFVVTAIFGVFGFLCLWNGYAAGSPEPFAEGQWRLLGATGWGIATAAWLRLRV